MDGHGIPDQVAGIIKYGIENILGLTKTGNKLTINPCIPKDWKEYTIRYKYKTSIYNIKVKNPNAKNTGVEKLFLNGKELIEKEIILQDNGTMYNVECIM